MYVYVCINIIHRIVLYKSSIVLSKNNRFSFRSWLDGSTRDRSTSSHLVFGYLVWRVGNWCLLTRGGKAGAWGEATCNLRNRIQTKSDLINIISVMCEYMGLKKNIIHKLKCNDTNDVGASPLIHHSQLTQFISRLFTQPRILGEIWFWAHLSSGYWLILCVGLVTGLISLISTSRIQTRGETFRPTHPLPLSFLILFVRFIVQWNRYLWSLLRSDHARDKISIWKKRIVKNL